MKLAVTSTSFCKRKILLNELKNIIPEVLINSDLIELDGDKLINFLNNNKVEACIVGREKINRDIITRLTTVKAFIKYGVGFDNIDIDYAKKLNIEVLLQTGTNKRSVAELALCFLIGLAHNIFITNNFLKQGNWTKDGGVNLSNKIVGVVGCGNTGGELIRLLSNFGCTILINDIIDKKDFIKNEQVESKSKLILTSKEQIFKECDFISLHVPLNSETKNLINIDNLKKMKSTSFVINTSRGEVLVEKDLKFALLNKIIAGAAIDVYQNEPPSDLEFLSLPNLVCTPHIGGSSLEASLNMGRAAIENVKKYFKI